MSAKYYVELWVATCDKIHGMISKEKGLQDHGTVSQPSTAHTILAELYASYILILHNLSDIFDQTLQVQKRELIKRFLIPVTKRVCELKKELCAIEMSDYIYMDHTLISTHLTPQDILFNRPNYFPMKRPDEYNEIIEKYLQRIESNNANERMIQLDTVETMKTQTEIEHTFLGMSENYSRRLEMTEYIECGKEMKRSQVEVFASNFEKTVVETKDDILKKKAHSIKEDISDFIRNWFRVMYRAAGDFDIYPSVPKGGSKAIVNGETMSPQEFKEAVAKRSSKQAKNTKPAKAKPKEKKKDKKKGANMKKEWNFSELSPAFETLETVMGEYERDWSFVDEANNPKETPYIELILPDHFAEMHEQLHLQVDEYMRVEYELLRKARCKDVKKKYKKSKTKGCGKKGKKGAGKKKTKRGATDITSARSIDSLIVELIENGILMDAPKKSFDYFIGDYNYLAYEKRNTDMTDPKPCLGELKTTIRSWILGMGPLNVEKVKSICLLGPPGCGKKHIIYAVAAEIGAVVFNLNSDVVYKYKENMPYFVHLVTKMATILQPAVLFIDGAHKPFIKKAPSPELKDEYKTLGKYLPKIGNAFKSTDRVLLMGATTEPWNSAAPKMKKLYEKFVLVSTDQYADKFLIWQNSIQKRIGFIPNIEISTLARVNIDYSVASILKAIDQVLTTSRLNMLRTCPLNAAEFMYAMSKQEEEPLDKKIAEKYRKWYVGANKLAKARQQFITATQKTKK